MIWLIGLEELDSLSGKCGKRGKASKESGKDKKSELIADVHFIEITPAETDDERTENVDDKCT